MQGSTQMQYRKLHTSQELRNVEFYQLVSEDTINDENQENLQVTGNLIKQEVGGFKDYHKLPNLEHMDDVCDLEVQSITNKLQKSSSNIDFARFKELEEFFVGSNVQGVKSRSSGYNNHGVRQQSGPTSKTVSSCDNKHCLIKLKCGKSITVPLHVMKVNNVIKLQKNTSKGKFEESYKVKKDINGKITLVKIDELNQKTQPQHNPSGTSGLGKRKADPQSEEINVLKKAHTITPQCKMENGSQNLIKNESSTEQHGNPSQESIQSSKAFYQSELKRFAPEAFKAKRKEFSELLKSHKKEFDDLRIVIKNSAKSKLVEMKYFLDLSGIQLEHQKPYLIQLVQEVDQHHFDITKKFLEESEFVMNFYKTALFEAYLDNAPWFRKALLQKLIEPSQGQTHFHQTESTYLDSKMNRVEAHDVEKNLGFVDFGLVSSHQFAGEVRPDHDQKSNRQLQQDPAILDFETTLFDSENQESFQEVTEPSYSLPFSSGILPHQTLGMY